MPAAPLSIPSEQVYAYAQYGRKGSRPRRNAPHALALKEVGDHTSPNAPHYSRRRSSVAPVPAQVYSFLPLPGEGEGWTISPTSSLSASPPAPTSLFASPTLSPVPSARRPSAARRRPSRADGDVRPSIDSGRCVSRPFILPPLTPLQAALSSPAVVASAPDVGPQVPVPPHIPTRPRVPAPAQPRGTTPNRPPPLL
ncbi:hypothetical protein FRC08_017763 [Ceratobasidium sp. 394]|nr:hypothetical protein FRC08_017763 [Ceratobasidium sp. 394]